MINRKALEETIIGSTLFDALSVEPYWSGLKPEYFQTSPSVEMAKIIDLNYKSGQETSLHEFTSSNGKDLFAEASSLLANTCSTVAVRKNIKILKDMHFKCNFTDSMKKANFQNMEIKEVLQFLETQQQELLKSQSFKGLRSFQEIGMVALEMLDKTAEGLYRGLKTGFHKFDENWTFDPGLHIIAGRPGMGKTSFALQVAQQFGVKCAFFSLEMKAALLYKRELGKKVSLSQNQLNNPDIIKKYKEKILDAAVSLNNSKVFIDDNPVKTVEDIKAQCLLMSQTKGLGAVFIDYATLMQGNEKIDVRHRIGHISRGLMELAKKLDIPIILLSQLNRSCEARPNKRPILSDLKEAGDLEQDSTMVIMLYADEVYDHNTFDKNMIEILVRKARNGAVGNIKIGFQREFMRFFDLKLGGK